MMLPTAGAARRERAGCGRGQGTVGAATGPGVSASTGREMSPYRVTGARLWFYWIFPLLSHFEKG